MAEDSTAPRSPRLPLPPASAGPPNSLPASGQAYAPPRMRSAAYAQAQAEWDAIENELAYTKDQCDSLRAQLKVAEETLKALRIDRDEQVRKAVHEADRLKVDNEKLLRENAVIGSSVRRAVDTLIGLQRELYDARNGTPDPNETSVEAEAKLAIERAMQEEQRQ